MLRKWYLSRRIAVKVMEIKAMTKIEITIEINTMTTIEITII